MNKMKTILRNPWSIFRYLNHRGMLKMLSDKTHVSVMYRSYIGKKLNLENPQTYNEKLQWIKLYDRKPEYTRNADKLAVREYIKNVLGDKFLVPLHGVYDNAEDIAWDTLPEKFVLKCTHGSGTNIICTDKTKLNKDDAVKTMNGWLKTNAFWYGREWCYKDIKPKIICEEFIETPNGLPPKDYKFMCFNGSPKLIQVHDRRGLPDYSLTYYTPDWKKTDIKRIDASTTDVSFEKPERLDEMLKIAETLANNTYFARVDLYYENDHIYFGEITYYPTSGFSTFDDDYTDKYLGSLLELPVKRRS